MELAKDLLGHGEHVLGQDLHAVIVDFLSAVHEVVRLHVGELFGEALAVLVFLLIARGVRVEAVRNNDRLEAVILAIGNTWLILLRALEETQVVLLINERAETFVQMSKRFGVKGLLISHYFN